ncbi:MAG TPA: hypothetical protein DHW22_13705 [Planctomycetaceae bacterium]|nr:hypothetical protein [Planctomycetaceae bacterium]
MTRMKTLLRVIIGSALVGLGLGAALAYIDVPFSKGPLPLVDATQQTISQTEPSQTEPSQAGSSKAGSSKIGESNFRKLPHAKIPETLFDFDRIERGTSMRHDFVIHNSGNAPLAITFESNTCKCTGVEMAGSRVEKGQSIRVPENEKTNITLEWAAKTEAGPFRHGARFSTNDPRNSSIELEVNGQVVESTSMWPAELLFGTVQAGKEKKTYLYVMSFLNQKVAVSDFKITPSELLERMEIQISPAEKSELPAKEATNGLKVVATYRSQTDIGPFRGWLEMTTNIQGAEKLLVPLLGNVKGDISVYGTGWNATKGLLRMGNIVGSQGKKVRLNLVIRGKQAEKPQMELVLVDPPELKVSLGDPLEISDDLHHVPVLVEIPAQTRPLVRMGEPVSSDAIVVFKSNHSQAQEIRMRVHFAVSQ